ncbi:MAG: DUF5906 domain-containing protein [Lentisphaeraceae bacterium]|nr:DUF5906 domain-containing protein [Lentisphaeraceae bacterium]
MTELQTKVTAIANERFHDLPNLDEFLKLILITPDDKMREVCEALEKAYERKDYVPPSLKPIEKTVFNFEVPSKKVSTISVLKKMEKEFTGPMFNQYSRLNDAKQKLEQDDFDRVMSRLIRETFKKTDCTAHEAFFVFETCAMQFGLREASKSLIDLISSIYTDYKYEKDFSQYKKYNEIAEEKNQLIESENEKRSDWRTVAERVISDENMTAVFPWLKNLELDDKDTPEALAKLVCLSLPDSIHLLLDPETLKYTHVRNHEREVTSALLDSHKVYGEYRNPLVLTTMVVEDKDGNLIKRRVSKADLYNNHTTDVQQSEVDLTVPHSFEVKRANRHGHSVLCVKRSGVSLAGIEPVFNEQCDEWLRALTGTNYIKVMAWVANSMDFGIPLPVLSFLGYPETGKSLLIKAIEQQMYCPEASITPEGLFEGQFNGAIATNGFCVADDGGLTITSENRELWEDRFKQWITKDMWTCNPKYGRQFNVKGYLRCYTAHNIEKPHVRKLFFRSATEGAPLGERILEIEVKESFAQSIKEMFKSWDITGENNSDNRWLGVEGHLTKHVAWIIANKSKFPVSTATGRWGNMEGYVFKGFAFEGKKGALVERFFRDYLDESEEFFSSNILKRYQPDDFLYVKVRQLTKEINMKYELTGARTLLEYELKDILESCHVEARSGSRNGVVSPDDRSVYLKLPKSVFDR